ncbi:MAG: tRNA (N(6)-L-threonylcarbamoyladenosine(37)-C(2))-methylthiotransferase MtaB [Acidobacteria bacterium]|nr:MAG: tRNA (N(6)-L-threonylcarbamoyladenosine(37)-C(2))-methylthiotransferase MtaB [Acidobacteriota bacterium]
MAKKFYIATFGCRTNQADSAALREDLLSREFEETRECRQADVIVVNSCTVTHRSDQQVRQLTRSLRRQNPAARLVVTGCYAQRDPSSLARITGVDAVVGNSHKGHIGSIVAAFECEEIHPPTHGEIAAIYRDDFRSVAAMEMTPATETGGRTRPFVKIQDGCDAKCTYCIIPYVRGPSRSVPPQIVLRQLAQLVENGFKEVVLTGIHMGSYGVHLKPRYSLDRLLGEIVAVPGLQRIRLSSIEPMQLSRRVIALAANCEKIAPHFHICLQSGSDRILKRMFRPYKTSRFASIVEEIRRCIPDAAIGTDVIAGFPGESEEDHRQTVEFIGRMPFTYLHVFPYSDRSGTAASRLADKVDSRTIKRRSSELRQISEDKNRAFRRRFLGQSLSVLTLSETKDGMRTALSGNYLKAKLDPSMPANQLVQARVVAEDAEGYQVLETPG